MQYKKSSMKQMKCVLNYSEWSLVEISFGLCILVSPSACFKIVLHVFECLKKLLVELSICPLGHPTGFWVGLLGESQNFLGKLACMIASQNPRLPELFTIPRPIHLPFYFSKPYTTFRHSL
jgi:hypothetical protein